MATGNDLREAITRSPDRCGSEPIHRPAAIQPHGIMLVLDPETLRLRAASANAAAVFGELSPWLPDNVAALCRDLGRTGSGQATLQGDIGLLSGAAIHVFATRNDVFCEVELPLASVMDASDRLADIVADIAAAPHTATLFAAAADGIRALSGFERVMVYRFDDDGNGEVVGESLAPDGLPSFLGLCFPASDIPAQARALYRRCEARWTPRRDYVPVPLVPATAPDGRPFDLSLGLLRSVSPIHRLYQKNINVDGTMSVSILRDGTLWGLVIGHHRQPHALRPACRQQVTAAVRCLTMRLDSLLEREAQTELSADTQASSAMLRKLAAAESPLLALTEGEPNVLSLFPGCSGAAVVHDDELAGRTVDCTGADLPAEDVLALVDWMAPLCEPVFATDALPEAFPPFAVHRTKASGVLGCFLDDTHRTALLLFRPEAIHTVHWAGKPEKLTGANGEPDLPRRSFDRWTEIRCGHSAPWRPWERDILATLCTTVNQVILRQAKMIRQLQHAHDATSAQAKELAQFAHVVSHDLREPLRMVSSYLSLLDRRLRDRLDEDERDFLHFAVDGARRMDRLIVDLLDYAATGRHSIPFQMVPLSEVLDETLHLLAPMIREAGAAVMLETPLPTVRGIRIELVRMFQNLIGNAVKYRAANRQPRVRIRSRRDGAEWLLSVQDNGIGINSADHQRAFAAFQRLVNRNEYPGTGLGLAICRKVVELHGGRIWIDSELGQGSTFFIALPGEETG